MELLVVGDMANIQEEILMDIDYESFYYDYEINTKREIHFTAYRTTHNEASFDLLQEENYIIYRGQQYIIKECEHNVYGQTYLKEITAVHVYLTCQDHVIYDVNEGVKTYSITDVMELALGSNKLGFSYGIEGSFTTVRIENLGDANALELINSCVEKFGAIVFADNKHIVLYDESQFYEEQEKTFRYLYNTDAVKVTTNTYNLKTAIKVFGALKENADEDKLTGDDRYVAVVYYQSPNISKYGLRQANSKSDERFTDTSSLTEYARSQILDTPEVALDLTYTDYESVRENEIWHFYHEPLDFDTQLKITRLKLYHEFVFKNPEVGFSNKITDMIDIQKSISSSLKKSNKNMSIVNSASTKADMAYNNQILTEVVKEV
ncbi:hypothetical protein HCI99_06080 [Listeria booriae]|uniref:Prophage tail endopeptidase domain-containing protein n=1 Tax=Listeria booriae TaxID=1552123 RepID=A0A7X1CBF9_9LIST|nr:phage tail protein [Listeria booriae]MBC1491389.1 hypothetical protein [Listeria booriae]